MEKFVYCLIKQRRKRIKIASRPHVTECESLRLSFLESCKKDIILEKMIRNKAIIFQTREDNGEWCNMEDDDTLVNGCEVNVVLIAMDEHDSQIKNTDADSNNNPEIHQISDAMIFSLDDVSTTKNFEAAVSYEIVYMDFFTRISLFE